MEDISKTTVIETLDTAKEYASKLEDLIRTVEVATHQVNTSAQQAIEDIDNAFSVVTSVLVEVLNKRRSILKTEALKFREDVLIHLKACHNLIAEKLKSTQSYIEEGHDIL